MTRQAQLPQSAGIYTRMSLAAMNDLTKVEDQARISRDLATAYGWQIASGVGHPFRDGVYTDNSRSAWKKDRTRPAWNQMLDDVETGKLDAIIVYHGDRLVRQPWDLETLIKLADGRGIRLASPTGMRDLDNTDDRFVLRILVAQACMESDNTSRRRKAQYARWRLEGKVRPGGRGGRAFGFEKDGTSHRPAEADAIRDAARRILLGESTGSIARSFPMPTTTGAQMTHGTLKKMLLAPRYAGLMPDGEQKAAWEPVLDRATWEMTRTIIEVRAAAVGFAATNGRKWLLSGIALCGECGKPLQIRQGYGRRSKRPQIGYGCVQPGCRRVHRAAALLDAYVTGWIVTRLNHPDNPQMEVVLHDSVATELAALEQRRAETEEYIANLAGAPSRRLDVLMRALDGFDQKIAALREQMTSDTGARLRAEYAGLTREQWDGLPLDVRRSLVRACCTVTVLRSLQRGPGFHPETIRVEPV